MKRIVFSFLLMLGALIDAGAFISTVFAIRSNGGDANSIPTLLIEVVIFIACVLGVYFMARLEEYAASGANMITTR